jgi:hypothetical protein
MQPSGQARGPGRSRSPVCTLTQRGGSPIPNPSASAAGGLRQTIVPPHFVCVEPLVLSHRRAEGASDLSEVPCAVRRRGVYPGQDCWRGGNAQGPRRLGRGQDRAGLRPFWIHDLLTVGQSRKEVSDRDPGANGCCQR